MWMNDAHSGSARADTRAINLLEALRTEQELKVFDGTRVHVLSIASHAVEYWHLEIRLKSHDWFGMDIVS
jgi:hypothetical protein